MPFETRQPFEDGHTDFERILPGPDRMYPDTDSPPTPEQLNLLGIDVVSKSVVGVSIPLSRDQDSPTVTAACVADNAVATVFRFGGATT